MRRGVSSPTMALLGAILICAAFMTACSQSDPQDAAALTALETHLGQVESQLKEVESQLEELKASTSSGDWVLWVSWQNIHNSFNLALPTAQSAFSTKSECLASADAYSFTTGKTAVVSTDPYIIRNGATEYTYRCLPRGVKPLLNIK
jgi:hypothetical protein